MDERILQVQEYPLAALFALDPDRPMAGCFGLLSHVVDQRLDVPIRRAAGNDHVVRHRRHVAHVEANDVFRLDVVQRIDDEVGQCFTIHAWFP